MVPGKNNEAVKCLNRPKTCVSRLDSRSIRTYDAGVKNGETNGSSKLGYYNAVSR